MFMRNIEFLNVWIKDLEESLGSIKTFSILYRRGVCACVCVCARVLTRTCMLHCIWLFANPWIVVHQALLYMEYWNGLPFPSPRDLSDPENQSASLAPLALAGGFFATVPLGKPLIEEATGAKRELICHGHGMGWGWVKTMSMIWFLGSISVLDFFVIYLLSGNWTIPQTIWLPWWLSW